MLHRVLKACGLGDAPVERVLPADWVLLNLKCLPCMILLPLFQVFASHSGFLEGLGDVNVGNMYKDSLHYM